MRLPQLLAAFATLAVAASAMEAIWYLAVAEGFYQERIGALMNVQFDVFVAFLFYFFYALGAIIFAVGPALQAGSLRLALRNGAMYGFFCFSAHNLTDLADVKGYSAQVAAIDMAWGTCMTAVACVLSYLLGHSLAVPGATTPTAGAR